MTDPFDPESTMAGFAARRSLRPASDEGPVSSPDISDVEAVRQVLRKNIRGDRHSNGQGRGDNLESVRAESEVDQPTTNSHPRRVQPTTEGMCQDISLLAETHGALFGELFPSLAHCATSRISSRHLNVRARNSLARAGCKTWEDLLPLSVGELWMVPNTGRLTVELILTAAQDQASLIAQNPLPASIEDSQVSSPNRRIQSPNEQAARRALSVFVDWARDNRGAKSVGELLNELHSKLPADVEAELIELKSLLIEDALPTLDNRSIAPNLIVDFLSELGSDGHLVVARNVANPTGRLPTLESLGNRENLTRERIRQIAKRGLNAARSLRRAERYRLLSWRAEDLHSSLGSMIRIDDPAANESIACATRGFADPDDCTAAEFMLWFAGEYRQRDGWWISGDLGHVNAAKSGMEETLRGVWLLSRTEIGDKMSELGITASLNDSDVTLLTNWRAIGDDWWVRWDGALGDKAERIFNLAARAISPPEMNELIGEGHANSSVYNILLSDDRFVRVSTDLTYALTEWGWEEYSTTAQEITERIERAGGEANLDDVVIELFNQFGLKETTVRAYAASPAFILTNGTIRLRRGDEAVTADYLTSDAEGLYIRADGAVVFHLPVDFDVLRGSGKSIPNAFSVALSVRPGDVRDFGAGESGRVRVSWPATAITGAAIGSTRSIAESLEVREGDVIRLVFDLENETVEGETVSGSSLSSLTGLSLTPGGEVAELASAIGVDPTEVRAALADRGDTEVAALIPDPSPSKGLDDALARLDDLLS